MSSLQKRILFVSYGGGHINALLPLIKALKKERVEVLILALTTSAKVLNDEGINYYSYSDFADQYSNNWYEYGKLLIGEENDDPINPVSYEESLAYHGINFVDLVSLHGEKIALSLYKKHGRQCFLPINFMKFILKSLSIDLLVATSAPRSERASFEAARDLGIASVCVIDLFAVKEVNWLSSDNYTSYYCVLNDEVKKHLIGSNIPEEKILVTGNPAFDSLIKYKGTSSEEFRAAKGWSKKDMVILFASQPEPTTHPLQEGQVGNPSLPLNVESELRRHISKSSNLKLVVRYHPSQSVSFSKQKGVYLSPNSEPLAQLLHAVDLCITFTSTVGLQAHLIGKPVISHRGSIFSADCPFPQMGVAEPVNNTQEMLRLVENYQKKPVANGVQVDIKNATNTITKFIMTKLL